jgi:DedD protein
MAWFNFGKKDSGMSAKAAVQKPLETVEAMRQRAKYRLIGAVVLVLAGVVGFPLLFDSQPRPVSVNIPIDIPDKTKVRPLGAPAAPTPAAPAAKVEDNASLSGKEEIVSSTKPDSKNEDSKPAAQANIAQPATKAIAAGAAVAAAGAVAAGAIKDATDDKAKEKAAADKAKQADAEKARKAADEEKAKKLKADKAQEAEKAKAAADASRAKALLEGGAKPSVASAAPPDAADGTRFIVQFGAFSDADKAREVRQKVERAGLKTYSQVAKTADGERIRVRVGPFASRAEADKAAAKIKSLDLPASVLTL